MICPNCGKINALKADNCTRCKYNLVEIKANRKPCRLQRIADIVFIMAIFMYIGFSAIGIIIKAKLENLPDSVFEIFLVAILCCVLLSAVLSMINRFRITLSNGRLQGYKNTTAIIRFVAIVLVICSGVFMPLPEDSQYTTKINARNLFTAVQYYAKTHNGLIPTTDDWIEEIDTESLNLYDIQRDFEDKPQPGLAINAYIAGKKLSDLPDDAIIIFETSCTQTSRKFFFEGVRPTTSLEIHNRKYSECITVLKSGYVDKASPEHIATLNWMNADKLVLPPTIDEYLKNKATVVLITYILTTVIIAASLGILVYLCFVKFAAQAIFLASICAIIGGVMGWLGHQFHYGLYSSGNINWSVLYISVAISLFIAACYCLAVYKTHLRLSVGCLRNFNSAAAIPAGILCSLTVHLLFMLLNFHWNAVVIVISLGWGVLGGSIMGVIANNLVFHPLLKWEPVAAPAYEEQPLNNRGQQ